MTIESKSHTSLLKAIYVIYMSVFLSSCSWVKPFCKEELWCRPDGVFDSVQEAVKVDLSQESIGYWDDYVDSLQPQFQMTSDKALSLALPKTSYSQNSLAEIFSLGLQVGLPQSTSTSSLTQALSSGLATTNNVSNTLTNDLTHGSTTDKNGAVTTGSSSYENKATAANTSSSTGNQSNSQSTATSLAPGVLPASSLPTASLPNAISLAAPSGALTYDPILTYKAASAIFEEVQLLNSYVKNAALRTNSTPFVARVQLTVSPYAHNEPYDVYIKLDTWAGCEKDVKKNIEEQQRIPVTVVPLLVTDNLEVSQTASALSAAKQLAASLGGIVGNVALQGQASDLINKYNAILGSDLNSLFTVGRSGENSLNVRIGASRAPKLSDKAEYGMLTQNHSVSFVVLVPNEYAENYARENVCHIDVLSSTSLRDAITGNELHIEHRHNIAKRLSEVIGNDITKVIEHDTTKKYNDHKCKNATANHTINEKEDLLDIYNLVQSGDIDSYSEFKECYKPNDYSESLWGELQEQIRKDIIEISAHFDIPNKTASLSTGSLMPGFKSQPILLTDNGDNGITLTVRGLGDIKPSQVAATLFIMNKEITVPLVSMSQPLAGSLDLKFPPFDTYNVTIPRDSKNVASGKNTATTLLPGVKLQLWPIDSKWAQKTWDEDTKIELFNLYYKTASKPDTQSGGVKLAAATDTVITDATGQGKLRVMVQGGKTLKTLNVSFFGAALNNSLLSSSNLTADVSGASLKLNSSGSLSSYDVPLQGLVPGRAVIVTAVGLDVDNAPIGQASITVPIVSVAKNTTTGQTAN